MNPGLFVAQTIAPSWFNSFQPIGIFSYVNSFGHVDMPKNGLKTNKIKKIRAHVQSKTLKVISALIFYFCNISPIFCRFKVAESVLRISKISLPEIKRMAE